MPTSLKKTKLVALNLRQSVFSLSIPHWLIRLLPELVGLASDSQEKI
jgi:hypothetical protein